MLKKRTNKIYSMLSTMLLVLTIITAVVIFGALKINDLTVSAATSIVTVNKKVSVDTYVYGEDVTYDAANSNLAVDKYIVENGSKIYIRAVNDTALFDKWTIVNNGVTTTSTNVHETITVNGEVTISLDVTEAQGFVNGKIKYDMIPVTEASHLLAIQKILEAGPSANVSTLITQYDLLFGTNNQYRNAADKQSFITSNKLFDIVQNGYYGINNNLSVFSNEFKGIGNATTPFKGVFVGVDEGTSIITTISQDESAGTNNYGLFSVLDKEAVLLNLNIQTSIGIKQSTSAIATTSVINAGGVAGTFNNAFIYNTNVKTNISITSGYSTINAGGIAGTMNGGLNSVNESSYDASTTNWIITNNSNNSNRVGYIAGYANAVYLKDFEINTTNSDVMLSSNSSNTSTTNNLGTLFGYYNGNAKSEIGNVKVTADGFSRMQSIVDYGKSYVGGAIGYVNGTNELIVGDINFVNTSNQTSKFISQCLDSGSHADVYSGGLFAYVTGTVTASDEFKLNIMSIQIEDKFIKKGEYIFSGNYSIESTYHGYINTDLTYGRCVAGGLVGKGYFNILGTDDKNSEILIHDNTGKLNVIATQSQTVVSQTQSGDGDIEHCIASLTFGLISEKTNTTTVSNIDVYATNVLVNAVRENGSKGMGDVRVAGFNGYSNGTSYNDINVYINHSNFKLDSLSYEVTNTHEDDNNAYCGGVFADVENATVSNCKLSGYDIKEFTESGTTLHMMSIQNTIASGGDYRDENYLGGIIGQVKQVYNITGLTYNGSEGTEDAIILQGHENPDSCFSGGLIGLIKGNDEEAGTTISISNCKVTNATVEAHATANGTGKKNLDIMLGGAFGALYNNDGDFNSTFRNIYVYDTDVRGNANEHMEINAGGIIGAVTWASSHDFYNCYVYGSKISASSTANINTDFDQAYAAGLIAHLTGVKIKVYNSAIIDSIITATGETAEAAGFTRNEEGATTVELNNCYINSQLNGKKTSIFSDDTVTYSGYNYYTTKTSASTLNNTYQIKNTDLAVTGANTAITANIANPVGNKVYPVLAEGTNFQVNNAGTANNVTISKIGSNANAVDVLYIWINAKDGGSTQNPTEMTLEAAHDAGWFLIETINVYSGSNTFDDLDHLADNDKFVYTEGVNEYKYSSGAYNGDNSNRYLEHILDSSIKTRSGYAEGTSSTFTIGTNTYNILKDIDINVYEGIHNIKLEFTVSNMPTYSVVLLDTNGNVITKNPNSLDNYGTYELSYNNDGSNKINYVFNYYPNPEMTGTSDITFYIAFKVGRTTSGTYYDKSMIKINLSPNVRKLEGLKPAEYSPPLNIRDANTGTAALPYILENGSITKFIPVFSRVNDLEKVLYDQDTNVEYATFTRSGTNTTMYSNGELKVNSLSNNSFTVTATSKINTGETAVVYCITANKTVYDVTYTSIGADVNSIGRATNECEFYFDMDIYSSYSSLLNGDNFKITVGSTAITTYMLYDSNGQKINDDPATPLNEALYGREGESKYTVVIPKGSITGTINITINLDVVYNVTFVLNCGKFNTTYVGPTTRTYKVLSGDSLKNYFDTTKEYYLELKQWVDDATLFGYAFNGFYLVDNADSLPAYGYDLDTLVKNDEKVNTSLTFYACWSFLIELIEAPGTHITTSFADSFMKDYYDEDKVTSTIKIPINSNRGYIFTIEKDPGFIGEAEVRAFALTKLGEEIITDEIAVEKYHENQYLYYIPPEAIKGYLVIATSVGNSEIIVGENSASVSENLLPYDGIYTFKYVVNHRNSPNYQSFIYNSTEDGAPGANLNYNRDVMLEFFEQTFNGTNLGEKPRYLEKGTVIEVYYNLYVNGTETKTVVGSYVVNDTTTTRVFLKDFTLINNDESTRAFEEITFKDLLGSNEMVSEVYYFSVTPPNGITLDNNKIINYIVNAGYYYNDGGNYRYIEGKRIVKDFVNKPLEGELEVIVLNESALHKNIYSVSPSRDTELTMKDETNLDFNFKDITDYHIMDLTVTNTVKYDDALKLKGTIGSRSTLTSSRLGFYIKDVEIVAGYNTGNIDVYGSNDGIDWQLVDTIYVESEEYQKYVLFFDENYTFFKLDNTSGKDIHIKELLAADKQTAIHYEIDFTQAEPIEEGTTLHYQLVNDIIGDIRHDSKKFMLAIQMYDTNGKIVLSIDPEVYLNINGTRFDTTDKGSVGRSVIFFNLSEIKDTIGLDDFDFKIVLPGAYAGYQLVIQLVEAKMSFKPAMDEVRETISLLKHAYVTYDYKYLSGAVSTGTVNNPNDEKVTSEVTLSNPTDGDLVFGGWYLDEELTQRVESISMEHANAVIYGAFYPQDVQSHTVTFKYESTEIYSKTLPEGAKIIVPDYIGAAPVGMEFAGWKYDSTIYPQNSVFEMGNSDVALTAYFEPREFTISFNVDSTRPFESMTFEFGSKVEFTKQPTKIGYKFAGWDTELGFNMPAYDMVITAKWTPITYKVVFNANGGNGTMSEQVVTYDESTPLNKNLFERDGYKFIGWATGPATNPSYLDQDVIENLSKNQDEVVNLYAIWSNTMAVKFEENGGTEVADQEIKYNDKVVKPTDPTRQYYTFGGWFLDSECTVDYDFNTALTDSITLYAKWTPNEYTLTIVYGNGQANKVITQAYGTAIETIVDPTRAGYKFLGWDKVIPTTMPGGGDTITAKWEGYTITYNANGGTCATTEQQYSGTALTIPTATQTGYKFTGWYTAPNSGTLVYNGGESVTPTEDITLYAHWEANVVTYNPNEGSVDPTSQTYNGTALTLPTPTREHYNFVGWYTSQTGGTKVGNAGESYTPQSNITLYAHWEINQYTVTFNANGGTVNPESVTVNALKSITLPTPQREGRDFEGWTYNDTVYAAGTSFIVTDDIEFVAKWSNGCVAAGTLILMADGTTKAVEDLLIGDVVLAFNHETGKIEPTPIQYTDHSDLEWSNREIINLVFSNGTILKIVDSHAIFNVSRNEYSHINRDNALSFIGDYFYNINNVNGDYIREDVQLLDVYITYEYTGIYNPTTYYHLNLFADGLLTTTPGFEFIVNAFEFDEDGSYDDESFNELIEKYGVYTYDDLSDYMIEEIYNRLPFRYLKISVGKGVITQDQAFEFIKWIASFVDEIIKDEDVLYGYQNGLRESK